MYLKWLYFIFSYNQNKFCLYAYLILLKIKCHAHSWWHLVATTAVLWQLYMADLKLNTIQLVPPGVNH